MPPNTRIHSGKTAVQNWKAWFVNTEGWILSVKVYQNEAITFPHKLMCLSRCLIFEYPVLNIYYLTMYRPWNYFFFFFKYLFVCTRSYLFIYFYIYFYIYFWLCWVFLSVRGLSPVAASGDHSSSRCAGPFTIAASPAAEHRPQTRRLSSRGSRAQPLRGMWDPPRPGLEPASPALAGRLSTTASPGKPWNYFLFPLIKSESNQ